MSKAMTCKQCQRTFASESFLRKHYGRRHPEANFDHDYPSKAEQKDRKEAESRQEQELLKANQEKLFAQLKADMIASMTTSMKALEKEISLIKSEQNKLQDIG